MKNIILVVCMILHIGFLHAENTPTDIVASFGEEMSAWCRTNDIAHRVCIENLCHHELKDCRVKDNLLNEVMNSRSTHLYDAPDTFTLDSFLNMYQSWILDGVLSDYSISDICVEKYEPIENVTIISAKFKLGTSPTSEGESEFTVRDNKITYIENHIPKQ